MFWEFDWAGSSASGVYVGLEMGSGTTIFGREAVATGTSGSAGVEPTWAGATELALAAAKISRADRSVTNMKSEFFAVNRHYRRATSH